MNIDNFRKKEPAVRSEASKESLDAECGSRQNRDPASSADAFQLGGIRANAGCSQCGARSEGRKKMPREILTTPGCHARGTIWRGSLPSRCRCVNRARGNHSTCALKDSVHPLGHVRGLRLMIEAGAEREQGRGIISTARMMLSSGM